MPHERRFPVFIVARIAALFVALLANGLARGLSKGLATGLALSLTMSSAHAADGTGRQALTTNRLKVCADPANLPFSNDQLEGFENRVVELVADELGLEVRYTWYPQTTGFVRNTLRLRACDLISGITTTSERVQNTNPYYQSVYTMVYRENSGIDATRMSDPSLDGHRLGVIAGTPPADILARLGRLGDVRPYQLVADTRVERPAIQALDDLVEGLTDAVFLWGPIAGWYAKNHPDAGLVVVPLIDEPKDVRMSFRVSMAMRYNETDWKRRVNRALAARAEEIEAVLMDYGVPLLDDRGRLVTPP